MKSYKINNEISSSTIRLKDSGELISFSEALTKASQQNTDLIELSTYDNNNISVCILQDYQKFLYQQKRKAKNIKASQNKSVLKEIWFGPQTDKHDYQFKLNHIRKFLTSKNRVKASVIFKGREIAFKAQGETLLLRLAVDVEDIAKIQNMPKLEGKRMEIILLPK